jgi:hypothetical protein
MNNEVFELEGPDRHEYFKHDDDIVIRSGDHVIIELLHDREAATWMIVPAGENPANYVAQEDDYDGVVAWLNEHDYRSEAITARRNAQLGL